MQMTLLNSKSLLAQVFSLALVFSTQASAEAVQIKDKGIKLNGDLLMADGKSLSDGVFLFTHGTFMHHDYSTAKMLKKNLIETGNNVLSISLSLGVDDRNEIEITACDRVHTHKHTDALTEIDAWVKWLESKGVDNITLVGHSRGGNQTAWYASLHNDNKAIKNVVLFAPAAGTWDAEATAYKTANNQDLKTLLSKAEGLVKAGKGDTLIANPNFVYCKDSKVTAAAFADYYQNNPNMNTVNVLKNVKKPVLVLAGSEDTVVVDLDKKLAPVMASNKNIEVFVIDGADHFFLDFAGEDAVTKMNEFVAK